MRRDMKIHNIIIDASNIVFFLKIYLKRVFSVYTVRIFFTFQKILRSYVRILHSNTPPISIFLSSFL